MANKLSGKRKILLLSGKSFLLLRKKDLRFFYRERPISWNTTIASISNHSEINTLLIEERSIFMEKFREWKRLFIHDEIKIV